jgi:Tol biopolymer transport system component
LRQVWTPDGKHVVYQSHYSASGDYALEWNRADGAGEPRRLVESKTFLQPWSFSPDGRHLAYIRGEKAYDIWMLPVDTSDPEHPRAGEPEPFLRTEANELHPAFSPDGRWVAYVTNESRRGREIYVRAFPAAKGAVEVKWLVAGGASVHFPIWSRNRRELFYLEADGRVMIVAYTTEGDSFVAEKPKVWSEKRVLMTELFNNLDLAPDGQRFVMFPQPEAAQVQEASRRMVVLVNFFDEVRRRVP